MDSRRGVAGPSQAALTAAFSRRFCEQDPTSLLLFRRLSRPEPPDALSGGHIQRTGGIT